MSRTTMALLMIGASMGRPALAAEELRERILSRYERVPLAHIPTPLEKMESLRAEIGGPPLYIKRDDQTGLAFGGNKARKLEFIFADVEKKQADVIVTWAGVQSNWARSTAAAARLQGVEPILVLTKAPHSPQHGGNLLLDALMGVDVRLVDPDDDRAAIVEDVLAELRAKGKTPYAAPVGGSMPGHSMTEPLGAISYAYAFDELYRQAQANGFAFDHVVLCTGGGGTQAGLMVGAAVVAPHVRIVGIHHSRPGAQEVAEIASLTAEALGLEQRFSEEETIVLEDYWGEGYGVLTKQIAETIGLVARSEGILLDPVYTGKAMWGLIDLVKKGYFEDSRGVVFLHTGGGPLVFAYEEELKKYISEN